MKKSKSFSLAFLLLGALIAISLLAYSVKNLYEEMNVEMVVFWLVLNLFSIVLGYSSLESLVKILREDQGGIKKKFIFVLKMVYQGSLSLILFLLGAFLLLITFLVCFSEVFKEYLPFLDNPKNGEFPVLVISVLVLLSGSISIIKYSFLFERSFEKNISKFKKGEIEEFEFLKANN
ncbi:MAG: hypothetical protein Q8Q04_01020 [archaeon]|nr:hypothetical protein [archaeon]